MPNSIKHIDFDKLFLDDHYDKVRHTITDRKTVFYLLLFIM